MRGSDHERHTNRSRIILVTELPPDLVAYVGRRWGMAGEAALLREHPFGPVVGGAE